MPHYSVDIRHAIAWELERITFSAEDEEAAREYLKRFNDREEPVASVDTLAQCDKES